MVIYCFRKLKSSLTGPDHQYVWAHKLILSSSNLFSWKILMWHPHPYPLLLMRGSHGKEVVQLLELFIITESSKNMCLKGVWMAQGGGPCAWQYCTNKFNQSHHLKGHIQTHGGESQDGRFWAILGDLNIMAIRCAPWCPVWRAGTPGEAGGRQKVPVLSIRDMDLVLVSYLDCGICPVTSRASLGARLREDS